MLSTQQCLASQGLAGAVLGLADQVLMCNSDTITTTWCIARKIGNVQHYANTDIHVRENDQNKT